MTLSLLFPVLDHSLLTDHGYLLDAAASHLAPAIHDGLVSRDFVGNCRPHD